MAGDTDKLLVSIEASITGLERQLKKAGVVLDDFAEDADKKADAAGKAINKHLGGEGAGSGGLNFNQIQELGHVARASLEGLASGANPLRVLAQEGVKASAAIGPDGLSGLADVAGAADAFLMWSKPAVLAGRRKAERLQFLTPDPAVAAARATDLAVKASDAKATAKVTQSAGGALIAAGAVAAPAAAAAHQPGLALATGGILALAGVISEVFAALTHRKATALAANAGQQSNVAHGLVPALQPT